MVLLLAVGGLLSIAAGAFAANDIDGDVQLRLEGDAERVASIVELQLARYATASKALATLRPTATDLEQWGAGLGRIGLPDDLVAVYSLGSTTLLSPDEVPAFDRELAALGAGGTSVRPALEDRSDRPERLVVIDRVHPLEANRPALGFDVLTNPAAAVAAERALATGDASMSDALTLVQEPGDQTGLAMYAPWYDESGAVAGLANLVLRGDDFVRALDGELGDLGLRIIDDVDGTERLVGSVGPRTSDFTVERTLDVMGQRLRLQVVAPAGYVPPWELVGGWLIALVLLLFTVLAAAIVSLASRREEHAVALTEERTAELVATNRDLERAVAVRDEFLTVVSHELRTPVTIIRGFAATAAAGHVGEAPDGVVELLRRIERQSRRLSRLIEDVLTAAELRSGHFDVTPEDIDLTALLHELVGDHAEDIEELRLTVPEGLVVHADRRHLVRCVSALLANAAIYGAPPIELSARSADTHVAITVRDHGPGVPDELAPQLFEPFRQADGGLTRRSRGIGLGLTIVRELSEHNGGSVHLVAADGGGASFELRLPAAPPAAPPGARSGDGPEVASPSTSTADDGHA